MAEQPRRRKSSKDPMQRGYARAEQKNKAAREALDPLAPGQRPGAVTVGAAVAALIAAVFWGSFLVATFTDATVSGRQPEPLQLTVFAAVMTAMAVGMWQARYWAVLGFQMLLVLFLLAASIGLLAARSVAQVVATVVLVGGLGLLFYKMVKAMARIQMPERRTPR
ncbi:MAG TPA: hypothetical protein VFD37_05720 [Solirubrobacterales bacterium]|nr:hypothetical protein [Solirubrobacterales bacterium]